MYRVLLACIAKSMSTGIYCTVEEGKNKVHHSEPMLGIPHIGKIRNIYDSTCNFYICSLARLISYQ